jgi:hypothetical protein
MHDRHRRRHLARSMRGSRLRLNDNDHRAELYGGEGCHGYGSARRKANLLNLPCSSPLVSGNPKPGAIHTSVILYAESRADVESGMTTRDRGLLNADVASLAAPQDDGSLGREWIVANLPRDEDHK